MNPSIKSLPKRPYCIFPSFEDLKAQPKSWAFFVLEERANIPVQRQKIRRFPRLYFSEDSSYIGLRIGEVDTVN